MNILIVSYIKDIYIYRSTDRDRDRERERETEKDREADRKRYSIRNHSIIKALIARDRSLIAPMVLIYPEA